MVVFMAAPPQEHVVVDRSRDHCSLDEAIAVPETTTLNDRLRAGAANFIDAEIHSEAEMATPFRSTRRIAASYPRNVLQCIRVAIEVARSVMDGASDLRDYESTAACLRYAFQDTDWSRKRAAGWSSRLAVRKGIRTNFQNCPADDSGADGIE